MNIKKHFYISLSLIFIHILIFDFSYGDEVVEKSEKNSSYTEKLKRQLELEDQQKEIKSSESYIEQLQQQLNDPSVENPYKSSEGYSEQLKKSIGTQNFEGYTNQEKMKMEPKEEGGAIAAFEEGRSEFKLEKKGNIHHATGIRIPALIKRQISAAAGVQLRSFDDVYQQNYVPGFGVFYEYQPYHHEKFGNFGFYGFVELTVHHAYGKFQKLMPTPWNPSQNFSDTSLTLFNFYTMPISMGLTYRFNLLKYIRPYVMAGPAIAIFRETRTDKKPANNAFAKGYFLSFGTAFLLDWLSKTESWENYSRNGIHHTYITLEYQRMVSLKSRVNFEFSGLVAGILLEL